MWECDILYYVILELERRAHTTSRQLSTCQSLFLLHAFVQVYLMIHYRIDFSRVQYELQYIVTSTTIFTITFR